MFSSTLRALVVFFLGLIVTTGACAEVSEVRISHGYGVLYLPLMVMASEKLMEKHARAAGLGEVKASYVVLDGGNVINDAMLSGALDIASIGVPGFLTLWAKAKDNPALEIRVLSGMSSSSLYLMTRNPNIKSLKDFSDKDRIAVPGIKTSLPAVMLHMVAAKELGDANYAKLDPITVDMTYTTRRFFEANPKLCAAFIAAMNEANALIARDSKKAAAIYLAVSKQKSTPDEIIRILADPNSKFSTVPNGTMKYAEFMSRVGTIKAKPATWKDLFFAPIHGA